MTGGRYTEELKAELEDLEECIKDLVNLLEVLELAISVTKEAEHIERSVRVIRGFGEKICDENLQRLKDRLKGIMVEG